MGREGADARLDGTASVFLKDQIGLMEVTLHSHQAFRFMIPELLLSFAFFNLKIKNSRACHLYFGHQT